MNNPSGLVTLVKGEEPSGPIAAGLAVVAEDTGRVLMLQRSLEEDGPASGKWEFPGGKLDKGESPLEAAQREWEEETGSIIPKGTLGVEWASPNGKYVLFPFFIKKESDLVINLDHEDRPTMNPDDPDGDNLETLAWWTVDDLKGNPALRDEALDTDWRLLKREVGDFHLVGQHDQTTHGRGRGGSVVPTGVVSSKATVPQDLQKLREEINEKFGPDAVQRINEAGHNVEDYNFRDREGNLTGKPLPGSDSWRDAHGISKEVYDTRPTRRWETSKDPVFDEAFEGFPPEQKRFAQVTVGSQSPGFIMERKPLPGAEEAGFGPISPQARPDNKVVIDRQAQARKQRELDGAKRRVEQVDNFTEADIIKERQTRVNKLEQQAKAAKIKDPQEFEEPARIKYQQAEKKVQAAEKSGDPDQIAQAKINRKIAKDELSEAKSFAKMIGNGDRERAVGIVEQDLADARKALGRAKADPQKTLQNVRENARNTVEKKQASLDKTEVKYAFPKGAGSASRMEAHQDPQNIKNLTEGKGRVYFVMEGQIKADSVLTAVKREDPSATVVSVPSVTAWNKDEVSWATNKYFKGRDVILIPDADGVSNINVVRQADTLKGRMLNSGAGNVIVAAPPLIKNKRGKFEVEDIFYPTGIKDGRKGVDDHLGLGKGTLGDLQFTEKRTPKFDLSKETGSKRIRPNAVNNSTRALESISDLAGDSGIGRISKDSIEKYSGLPSTSTKDSVELLEKKGYIKVHHIFNPQKLAQNRREPTMEYDEIKRITKRAGVGIPDLSKKYVLDEDNHEVAPIIEILDSRFLTKSGATKNLASQFSSLQTSDRVVRTPEGAARYGVSIGSKIPGALSTTGVVALHLVGQHDQSSHGSGGGGGSAKDAGGSSKSRASGRGALGKGEGEKEIITEGGYKTFRDRYAANEWGEKHYQQYNAKASTAQKKALDEYVWEGTYSDELRKTGVPKSGRGAEIVKELDAYIENSPRVPEKVVTFRGMNLQEDSPLLKQISDKSLVGKTLKDPAYSSFSLERRVAEKYTTNRGHIQGTKQGTKVIFEVDVPKGAKSNYASVTGGGWPVVRNLGKWITQTEMVMPRNTGMKVSSISEPDSDGVITISAKLVQ